MESEEDEHKRCVESGREDGSVREVDCGGEVESGGE